MNWFKSLFKRNQLVDPADFSVLKTDMHSHLIPGIDDGSKDLDDSVAMIRKFREFGFQHLYTTPHIMSDFYKNTPEIINEGIENVKKELQQQQINVEIKAAAEYYLDEYFEEKIRSKNLLTLGENYVLFELPFMMEPSNLNSIIFELQTNGFKPILAHPERYGYWYTNFEKYQELSEKGVFLQLNMLSLIGHYSPQTQKIAERLIDAGLVRFLGSDCHNLHHLDLMDLVRRKPYLHKLLESGNLLNASLVK